MTLKKSRIICFVLLGGVILIYCGWPNSVISKTLRSRKPFVKYISDILESSPTADGGNKTSSSTVINTLRMHIENVEDLYDSDMILDHSVKFKWIKSRMKAMADTWDKAACNLSLYKPFLFLKQKNILLFPGLLNDELCPNCKFGENAFKGGPVGELIQWTDLIVSLFMLGHKITVIITKGKLAAVKGADYDVIISDYIGLTGLQEFRILPDYYCRVRVLDTFGSEPLEIFNTADFASKDTHRNFRIWKFQNSKQFWTLYPHTPDNSFLGFAMEVPEQVFKRRKNKAVIYGKQDKYMDGRENYVTTIGEKLELHSTFANLLHKNMKIINHGIVDHTTLSGLLQSSKLFIGLGFPYEGPGPLNALANGCPYIQPKFVPPRGRKNEEFFKQKPTTRTLTSQSPYLEDYVGEPYVFTVDANNMSAVKEVVDKVMERGDLPPYIPYEFTQQGMMERVGAYIIYQDFCRRNSLTGNATISVSSYQPDHPATHATDDDPKGDTCYHSNISSHSWWQADLSSEKFIREMAISIKSTKHCNKSMILSLRDSAGFNRTRKMMMIKNGSLLLNWADIDTMARHVRIDVRSSVPDQLMLCKVDIYGTSTFWPKPSLMKVVHSEDDESCNAACTRHHLLCERSFFPLVNSFKALNENFNCKSMKETTKYMNVFPSYILSDDKDNEFGTGTCVTTKINSLLSCNGAHQGFLRLCPCRQYRKGQVALPIEL